MKRLRGPDSPAPPDGWNYTFYPVSLRCLAPQRRIESAVSITVAVAATRTIPVPTRLLGLVTQPITGNFSQTGVA